LILFTGRLATVADAALPAALSLSFTAAADGRLDPRTVAARAPTASQFFDPLNLRSSPFLLAYFLIILSASVWALIVTPEKVARGGINRSHRLCDQFAKQRSHDLRKEESKQKRACVHAAAPYNQRQSAVLKTARSSILAVSAKR
jgi:hypothetical protein